MSSHEPEIGERITARWCGREINLPLPGVSHIGAQWSSECSSHDRSRCAGSPPWSLHRPRSGCSFPWPRLQRCACDLPFRQTRDALNSRGVHICPPWLADFSDAASRDGRAITMSPNRSRRCAKHPVNRRKCGVQGRHAEHIRRMCGGLRHRGSPAHVGACVLPARIMLKRTASASTPPPRQIAAISWIGSWRCEIAYGSCSHRAHSPTYWLREDDS